MSNRRNRLPLEEKFRWELVKGKTVVAGVSGGADSMALLHLLFHAGIPVTAVHLNHGLRGAESDRDEELVRCFCARLGVPFRVKHLRIAGLAAQRGLGEEDCGRRERYAFFEEVRLASGPDAVISTAHTLSDQLETLLFRLARGTGLSGMCGIPERRGSIVRPLLGCTRRDVEEYCALHGVTYVTDSTNADPRYARNRIRLEAVPALKKVNPAAEAHAGQLAQSLALDRAFLEDEAGKLLHQCRRDGGLLLAPLCAAHPALSTRAIGAWLEEAGVPADFPLLSEADRLARGGSGRENLPGGRWLAAGGGRLRIDEPCPEPPAFSVEVAVNGREGLLARFPFPDGRMAVLYGLSALKTEKYKKIYKFDLIFLLDYDTIVGRLLFRYRLTGDRIQLAGRGVSRPLKKIYSESGLPLRQRRQAVVAEDGKGIVWAEHCGTAGRPAPGPDTRRFLLLAWEDNREGGNEYDERRY